MGNSSNMGFQEDDEKKNTGHLGGNSPVAESRAKPSNFHHQLLGAVPSSVTESWIDFFLALLGGRLRRQFEAYSVSASSSPFVVFPQPSWELGKLKMKFLMGKSTISMAIFNSYVNWLFFCAYVSELWRLHLLWQLLLVKSTSLI